MYKRQGREYDKLVSLPGAKTALVSYADEVEDALAAAELLAKEGIPCDVYKLVRIFPFGKELVQELSAYSIVLMAEECACLLYTSCSARMQGGSASGPRKA